MDKLNLVNLAAGIAEDAHHLQFRRDGATPYITHPAAVVALLAGESDEVLATAWLHDVLEDTPIGYHDLRMAGIPREVREAVVALTKDSKHGEYQEYLERVKRNEIARKVKIADMRHNLSCSPTNKQIEKYTKGIEFLTT